MYRNTVLFFFLCLFIVPSARAIDPEIGGLVLDRSISRFGKDFYREFSIRWQEANQSQSFNVVVEEQNIPSSGTVLWVEINGQRIFQTFFGRRQSATTRQLAEQANGRAINFVMRKMFEEDNPDIAKSGF